MDYVPNLSPLCQRMARRCWPGPVTLVLKDDHPESSAAAVARLPCSDVVVPQGTVGFRVPAHQLILDVLRLLPGPLALTSANRSGEPDAITGQDVVRSLQQDVDLVLDDGRSQFAQPSSVVHVDERGLRVLRAGVVSEETLQASGQHDYSVCLHRKHVPKSDGRRHLPQAVGRRRWRVGRTNWKTAA